MRLLANLLLFIGAVGIGVLMSLNLYELIAVDDPAAAFFSDGWWTEYWGFYAILVSVLLLGVLFALTAKRP